MKLGRLGIGESVVLEVCERCAREVVETLRRSSCKVREGCLKASFQVSKSRRRNIDSSSEHGSPRPRHRSGEKWWNPRDSNEACGRGTIDTQKS